MGISAPSVGIPKLVVSRERLIRGRISLVLILVVAILYCVFLIPFSWILLPVPFVWVRRQYRRWVSTVQLLLLGFLGYALEFICRIRIVITGGEELLHILPGKPLLMSNHHCELDWMFLVCLSLRLHRLSLLKLTTWEDFVHVPFLGWLIQAFAFIPICGRDKVRDLATIRNVIEYLTGIQHPMGGCTVGIFPEGCSLATSNSLEKSHRYAEKVGLPKLNQVLIPRASGVYETIRTLNRLNSVDSVIDVTIAYMDFIPFEYSSIASFWTGRYPREVHLNLSQVRWVDIPLSDVESVNTWLVERWLQKERSLERFYSPLNFIDLSDVMDPGTEGADAGDEFDQLSTTSTHMSNLATLLTFYDEDGTEPCEETLSKDMRVIQYISNSYVISAVVALMVVSMMIAVSVAYPERVLLYVLSVCLIFSVITRWINGFNIFELEVLPVQVDLMPNEYYPVDMDLKPKGFIEELREFFSPPKNELETGRKDKDSYIRAMKNRRMVIRQSQLN